jgi:hypothetical protein
LTRQNNIQWLTRQGIIKKFSLQWQILLRFVEGRYVARLAVTTTAQPWDKASRRQQYVAAAGIAAATN